MFGVVLGHASSAAIASGVCTRGTLETFCDMEISEALLHNKLKEFTISGIQDASTLSTTIDTNDHMKGLFMYSLEVDDGPPPVRLLGLHCATVAVHLLEAMYDRYDDCFTPKSNIRLLNIKLISLEEDICIDLAHNLSHNKRLKHLLIDDGGISTTKAMEAIAKSLYNNISLQWLRLEGHGHITDLYTTNNTDNTKNAKDDNSNDNFKDLSASPIVHPFCKLIQHNKARSCRSEIAEPVVFRALSLPNNGLREIDAKLLGLALREDVVLTSLDISNNNIGLLSIGETILDYGLVGMNQKEILYSEKLQKNWKLLKSIKTLCALLMKQKKALKVSIECLMEMKARRKKERKLNAMMNEIELLLPTLTKIGMPGITTEQLFAKETKEEGWYTWKELLRFLSYVKLPKLKIIKQDERTGKVAQCRNVGLISLCLKNCTKYTSGKLKPIELKEKVLFSHCLRRLFSINNNLTSIDLSRNRLSDTTAQAICNGLATSPTIVCIILNQNRFSNLSVPIFQTMVRKCRSLHKLCLGKFRF